MVCIRDQISYGCQWANSMKTQARGELNQKVYQLQTLLIKAQNYAVENYPIIKNQCIIATEITKVSLLKAKQMIINIFNSIISAMRHSIEVPEKVVRFVKNIAFSIKATADKTEDFILRNKHNIFFVVCSLTTAFFAPELFIPSFVATLLLRVGISCQLKSLADYYIKDEHNPYKQSPNYGPEYNNSFTVTMAVISAIDALALGTIYTTTIPTVALLPIMGGIAAGNAAAKFGMDVANSWI